MLCNYFPLLETSPLMSRYQHQITSLVGDVKIPGWTEGWPGIIIMMDSVKTILTLQEFSSNHDRDAFCFA